MMFLSPCVQILWPHGRMCTALRMYGASGRQCGHRSVTGALELTLCKRSTLRPLIRRKCLLDDGSADEINSEFVDCDGVAGGDKDRGCRRASMESYSRSDVGVRYPPGPWDCRAWSLDVSDSWDVNPVDCDALDPIESCDRLGCAVGNRVPLSGDNSASTSRPSAFASALNASSTCASVSPSRRRSTSRTYSLSRTTVFSAAPAYSSMLDSGSRGGQRGWTATTRYLRC